jgi:hypothetical protein
MSEPKRACCISSHSIIAATLLFAVALLAACGGNSNGPTAPSNTPTRVITLTGNLSFGSVAVGSTATSAFTITNSGNSALTVSGISASNGMNSVLLGSWLSGTVPAGGTQQVNVEFAPASPQFYSGTLTVASDATGGVGTIAVSGTGTSVTAVAVPGFYVWGGANHAQYLGFFTCVFCTEFDANSINNQFGIYGSQFSATSIRNQFSQYGSQFSNDSACDQFASNPPRVYNSNQSVYYGELTLNQFRSDAITTTGVVNWLAGSVCAH